MTLLATGMAVPLAAGTRAVTVGAVVSTGAAAPAVVNVQVAVASEVPDALLMAELPPVSVAVYWVPAARFADGSRVAVRVAAS